MNKVLICTGGGVGGAERISVLISKILIRQGFESKLFICIGENDTPNILNFIPDTIFPSIIKCKFRRLGYYLHKGIKKEKPDIIFSSMPLLICLLVLLKPFFFFHKYKLIARQYTMPGRMKKDLFYMTKLILPFVDIIVAQTNEMRDDIIRCFNTSPSKIVTIYNPIDKELIKEKLKESFKMSPDYINFVAVGRIAVAKNYEVMLNAFKLYLDNYKKARLYIIGKISDSGYCASILKLVNDLKLTDFVFFEGLQYNPYKYIASADVFLLSSKVEGLPNAMIEAMYIGIPVVSTQCVPFVSQVIEDGVNGFTVGIGDYQKMASAMDKATKLKRPQRGNDITNGEVALANIFKTI